MSRETFLVRFRTRSATQYLTNRLFGRTARWLLTLTPELAYTFPTRDQAQHWIDNRPALLAAGCADELPIPTDATTEVVALDQARSEAFTLPEED